MSDEIINAKNCCLYNINEIRVSLDKIEVMLNGLLNENKLQ